MARGYNLTSAITMVVAFLKSAPWSTMLAAAIFHLLATMDCPHEKAFPAEATLSIKGIFARMRQPTRYHLITVSWTKPTHGSWLIKDEFWP
ncbi:hypothetical protein ACH5RR_021499 [Cinchona calisaya]|uniref:Secreted protein n=1 Tax=Cinchona calisaya TaxID=153742 RepID=A0ABD2ZL17_9GENT